MRVEKIVVGEGTEYPLNGLLTLPDDTKNKVPGVVFVHGSGPSNMDEQVYKLTPFKDLAEGLAERGIASIRYDKRTFVYGRKMSKQIVTAKEETIDDAILAAKLLQDNPNVNPNNIFIIGHSMGAMLAPRIDAECGLFKGLILMAGTPYRIEDIMIRQFKQAGSGKGGLIKWIAELEDKIFTKKFDGLYEMPDEEAKKKRFFGSTSMWYFKEMGQKTAAEYLNESEKPVLIMQGGRDFQVLASVDFEGFKEKLKGRTNIEYRLYDELNHLFVKGIYGEIAKAAKEYKVEQRIGQDVIEDIAGFINNYVNCKSKCDSK